MRTSKKLNALIPIVILWIMAIQPMMLKAGEIKMQKATFEDYIPLLEMVGYNVYSFDIKSFNDKLYNLTFSCREYEHDSLINENVVPYPTSTKNMTFLSDFSEKDQATILPEELYDVSRGIYKCAEKIVIGTFSKNDSTTVMMIDVENKSTFTINLILKPLLDNGKQVYIYHPRPFKTENFKENEFVPLVFYGSAWFDERFGFYRFCGENELNQDMSSHIIKDVPHSYVLGVTITEISTPQ